LRQPPTCVDQQLWKHQQSEQEIMMYEVFVETRHGVSSVMAQPSVTTIAIIRCRQCQTESQRIADGHAMACSYVRRPPIIENTNKGEDRLCIKYNCIPPAAHSRKVEVSDTTGDAMKTGARLQIIPFYHYSRYKGKHK
jgi:hypothetical protein